MRAHRWPGRYDIKNERTILAAVALP